MQMALGFFIFGLPTASYAELQRSNSWRHAEQQRINARPSYQYLGPGAETITLSGELFPEVTGGRMTLDLLRVMAEEGKAWPLIEGSGRNYGFYAITDISETDSIFLADGSPKHIKFSLSLTRADEKKLDLLSTGISAATSALTGMMAGQLNKLRSRADSVGNIISNPLR